MSILYIIHALPPVLVFELGVHCYHITHMIYVTPSAEFYTQMNITYITCIPPSANFLINGNVTHITCITTCACFWAWSLALPYYTYYMHYPLYWFFHSMPILHILHIMKGDLKANCSSFSVFKLTCLIKVNSHLL